MDLKGSVIFLITVSFNLLYVVRCANILVVTPLPSRSHFKSFQPLFEELIVRGHNLTVISGHNLDDSLLSNYSQVDVRAHFGALKIVFAEMRMQTNVQNFIFCSNVIQDYIEKIFESQEVQNVINSKQNYDLVIAEIFYCDAILAFGHKFNAPVVALSAQSLISSYSWLLGNPFPSSYVPNSFLPFTEKMSLPHRIINVGFNIFSVLFFEFVSLPRSQAQIEKYFHFDKGNVPHIKDIVKNVSLTLVNSHYSFGYHRPSLPNILNVAGLHFTRQKPLLKNIQKFVDEAEHGVIYFSLGSLIEPSTINDLGEKLIRVFGNISQRVIMKWDPKLLTHIPSNVLVLKWVSQVDILNHPNCRLFITHGGLHSLLESLNASVPLIGVPFFTDQKYNLAVVEYYGIGMMLELDDIATKLSAKIYEALHNPNYKQNIEKRSALFRERLTDPLETAIFWIEHIIKHKDTAHLRAVSSQLPWYVFYSLDVFAIFMIFILLILYALKTIILRIMQKRVSLKSKIHTDLNSWQKENLKKSLKYE